MSDDSIGCAFCSDDASGYAFDGEPTCGSTTCEPVARPFPRVIEVSSDDEDDDPYGMAEYGPGTEREYEP